MPEFIFKEWDRRQKLKILLIGDFSDNYDEGLKNVAKNFLKTLSQNNEVTKINIKDFSLKKVFLDKNDYEIIHYFTAPTAASLLLLKILSLKFHAKTVISALHPDFSSILKNNYSRKIFQFFLKSDIILYQSEKEIFDDLSKKTIFFPNGVDVKKFQPVSKEDKIFLRRKYGIKDEFTVLHVGHIYKKRNLEIFCEIQKIEKTQVVLVGGDYLEIDNKLRNHLENNGCFVITDYLQQIEEIYAIADCYVFPVLWGNTICMPLSILEALSLNLPVIALNDYQFPPELNKSIFFVKNTKEITSTVEKLKNNLENGFDPDSRDKMLEYSWKNLTLRLENVYKSLL